VSAVRPIPTLALAALLLLARGAVAQQGGFDHAKHAKLFPSCTTCHAGAAAAGAPLWPDPAGCAACHDGQVQRAVRWQPPEPGRYNLRFDHVTHAAGKAQRPTTCVACHAPEGASWMTVERPLPGRCFECHGIRTAHLAAPDSACATCHLPLAQAPRLTTRDVASFQAPPDHAEPGFAGREGHGAAAQRGTPIAASCATCHAREFCLQCHVDAPEQRTIQALASDGRSSALVAHLAPPPSHADARFLETHGAAARGTPLQCSSCHTRESCLTCHLGQPRLVARMPLAGEGRGTGAVITRRPPPSHGEAFVQRHAAAARASQASCTGCHVRADCLECHLPNAARAAGYHPAGFLARHPAAAYGRETSCSDCHNSGGFCTSCHARAGLTATGPLRAGYHDARQFFTAGHGGAARQSLETCVSCHTERDCLACHSAVGGRSIDPHGPGFDAARLIKKNPQMCTACHGKNIPTQ
jgi:hypothetical protein